MGVPPPLRIYDSGRRVAGNEVPLCGRNSAHLMARAVVVVGHHRAKVQQDARIKRGVSASKNLLAAYEPRAK